ncbi:MAG: Fibronectin type domain protein [Bacteroidetes bacterium]|jgi:uncharacterized repeat protein (TIGR03803 family)|nr:Fibronectin type domain protein [Bacteroidota bacterium]
MTKKTSFFLSTALAFLSFSTIAQTPVLIGTTSVGGGAGNGSVYYVPTGASSSSHLTGLPGGSGGSHPYGSIAKAANGKFYGMAYDGGANGYGGIYEFGYTGPYVIKYSFTGTSTGANPNGALVMANNGLMYGMTRQGGVNGYGILFSYAPGSGTITVLRSFGNPDGIYPNGSLIQSINGKLYGLTTNGGAYGYGTLFSFDIGTSSYTVLHDFNSSIDGGAPKGSLLEASNGKLYGLTSTGGSNSSGTIFEYNIGSTVYTALHHFNTALQGANPEGDLVESGIPGRLWGLTKAGGANGFGTIFEYVIGGGFTRHFDFQNGLADGGQPSGSLTYSAYSGNLYGVTNTGGLNSVGTFFEFTTTGSFSKKFDFNNFIQGSNPLFVKLLEYEPLTASISGSGLALQCNGMTTASATVTPTGGTPPYTYSWAPSGGTGPVASGLGAGNYTCTITELGGYQITKNISVTQPPALFNNTSGTNILCNGMATGSATITPSGGTGGYTYSWAPSGGTGLTATGLGPATYTSSVTDANGCIATYTVSITEPVSPLTVSLNYITNAGCYGANNGEISMTASGGTPGYTYSWSSSGTSATESWLVAGNYTLTVTDANGCVELQNATVTEPTQIITTPSGTNPSCFGGNDGTATMGVSGGTPGYTYSIDGGTTYFPSNTFTNLNSGSFSIFIVDAVGCFAADVVNLSDPPALLGAGSSTDVTCFGGADGTVTTAPTGGVQPYTYLWNSGQTTATATGVIAGNYTVNVTDANSCVIQDFATVNEPTELVVSPSQTFQGCAGTNLGSADANASGGSPPYGYSWSSGGSAANEVNIPAGSYTVAVTDDHGCVTNGNVTITEFASTDLTGLVTALTLNITSGTVYAFKQQGSLNGIDTVATIPIASGPPNSYTFSSLPADNYYIKVIADTLLFPTAVPTYYGDEFQWDSSLVVSHGCSVTDVANIEVIELLPPGGSGFVSGYVFEGEGYGALRIMHNGNTPNLPFVPGGPLKGIDVKLGKNPAGGIQARVMTDTSGYYEFENVPDGDYRIYVDIPNLPMDSLREVSVGGAAPDSSVQNNYIADSLSIFIIDTIVPEPVGIYSSAKAYDNKFSIYPNPAKDRLSLSFDLGKAGDVSIELTDALGQTILHEQRKNSAAGTFTHQVDITSLHLNTGVYFVSILSENRRYTQRIVVIE